ncbi:unnamed protein product [Effrenium voratum]|nr:unnamed protein product [Effrenium voratum]
MGVCPLGTPHWCWWMSRTPPRWSSAPSSRRRGRAPAAPRTTSGARTCGSATCRRWSS